MIDQIERLKMFLGQQTPETLGQMTVKASPPVAVLGAKTAGFQVADWIQYATFVYVILMVVHKAWHMWKEWKTGQTQPGAE